MEFSEIKKQCNKIERHLIALEAERDTLLALLKEQEAKLLDLETQKDHNKKGQIFLRLKAADTRIAALATIEEIVKVLEVIFNTFYNANCRNCA